MKELGRCHQTRPRADGLNLVTWEEAGELVNDKAEWQYSIQYTEWRRRVAMYIAIWMRDELRSKMSYKCTTYLKEHAMLV